MRKRRQSKYCCPACGHPVMPTDPLAFLSMMQRVIFDVVYGAGQAGILKQAIEERVYGNRRNGAASSSIVSVHVANANKRLRLIGMEIKGDRHGGRGSETTYRVRRLPQELADREAACAS